MKNKAFTLIEHERSKSEGRNEGFTLIELLVAVAIFSLIVGAASGVFISALRAQRKSLASQELLDQTGYLMEYMSRALRMARKDLDGGCTGVANLNYRVADNEVEFVNYKGECQKFYLSGIQLKEQKGERISDLTSSHLQVSKFNITPLGHLQTDDLQPRIAFFLEIKGKEKSEIKIQTTISQRNPDVLY